VAASRIACFTFLQLSLLLLLLFCECRCSYRVRHRGLAIYGLISALQWDRKWGLTVLSMRQSWSFLAAYVDGWRALVSRQLNRLITQSACTYKLATVDCGEVSLLQETLTEATSARGERGQIDDSSFKIQVGTTTTLIKKQRGHGSKMTLQQRPTTMPPVEFISFSLQSTIRHYEVIF